MSADAQDDVTGRKQSWFWFQGNYYFDKSKNWEEQDRDKMFRFGSVIEL